MLALENNNGNMNYNDLGQFKITDTVDTRYSPQCINMVESTNTNPKSRVNVSWVAPTHSGTRCVLIRATILQHRDVWYMDDGGLTKRICEEVVDDVESQKIMQSKIPCCACDEARYELDFEGVWSRNLHPKDFPTRGWTTRFTTILGASHVADYRFWEYNELATKGMTEFAEYGSSYLLEEEFTLNFKTGKIRTIIKARGLAFPNLNGHSIAEVRVDPQHHLISLASKIDPSPDWIVGVSGLNLCMPNCTWVENRVVNLYPWDVGTDAGPSYTSADQPQVPPDVIRRIRPDFPNDPRSPFYNENGVLMKPFAILSIRKKRTYERLCNDEESNNINVPRECITHPWSPWSKCTSKCREGTQFRIRVFKQPEVAGIYNCDAMIATRQDRSCFGMSCSNDQNMEQLQLQEYNIETCRLSDWGSWSTCNTTCGGVTERRRYYLNMQNEQNCQEMFNNNLIETRSCDTEFCSEGQENNPTLDYENNENFFNNNFPNIEPNNKLQMVPHYDENIRTNQGLQFYNFEGQNLSRDNKYFTKNINKDYQREISYDDNHAAPHAPAISVPAYCFEPLQMFTCLDTTVAGNFWFYNYCEDECMIYATDSCDRNANKFNSLEMCELRCRMDQNTQFLKKKQLQDCQYKKLGRKQRVKSRFK